MEIEKISEELDEANAEIEKLRSVNKVKEELCESLKRSLKEQLAKYQEANAIIEKQTQQLIEKEDEVSIAKKMCDELNYSTKEKDAIVKHLSAANDKLRLSCDEKLRKLEEENQNLVIALDEANSKTFEQEQKLQALNEEARGLRSVLTASEKKCSDAEKNEGSNKLRQGDNMLFKLEEEKMKLVDQLKWKKEQFKHLEEAHEKLRVQFQASKKEWDLEKTSLIDEISTLQIDLDSQTRISEDLQRRLQSCNQALAHEESRRKYLEVQLSETKTSFEDAFAECQEAKSKIDSLTGQRDKDIASLRDSLGKKEMLQKELEYRVVRLEQENEELLSSLKELQEAQIQEAGSSSSLSNLRNKLKGLENIHRECSKKLKAREAEWMSEIEKMTRELTDCRLEIEHRDEDIEVLQKKLDSCDSLIMQLELQKEEASLMLLVLKSGLSEAQLMLADTMSSDSNDEDNQRDEKVPMLMEQLDLKNTALVKAQTTIEQSQGEIVSLLSKVESLSVVEQQQIQLLDELEQDKKMLKEQLDTKIHDLVKAQKKIEEDEEKMLSMLSKIESLQLVEQKQLEFLEDLERDKKMLKEQLDTNSDDLVKAQKQIEEDEEKMLSLLSKVESLHLVEQRQLELLDDLERHKEMLKESFEHRLQMKEKMGSDSNRAHDELANWKYEVEAKDSVIEELEKELVEAKDSVIEELEKELVESRSLVVHLELQNEETSLMLLVFKSELLEARSKLANDMADMELESCERQEKVSVLTEQLEMANAALVEAQLNIEEERENMASLLSKIESLSLVEQQQLQLQVEHEKLKLLLKESSESQLNWRQKASRMKNELSKAHDALNRANDELAEKFCVGNELEFELQIWKAIAERLKANLDENQQLRKQVEGSLLAQVEVEVTLKQDKECLDHALQMKERIIGELQRQLELNNEKIPDEETTMCLEQEWVTRELEGAILAHISAERNYEHEKDSFNRLVLERDQRISVLHNLLLSVEQKLENSASSVSSQLAEKQAEIDELHKAWEKMATTEVLNEIELQQKVSTIAEMEADFTKLQNSVYSLQDERDDIVAELRAKQLEIEELTSDLRTSEARINNLQCEKRAFLEDVNKLSADRENLLELIGSLSDRMNEFSVKDEQLSKIWERLVQDFDDDRRGVDDDDDDCDVISNPLKENMDIHFSPAAKRVEENADERSPLRALN